MLVHLVLNESSRRGREWGPALREALREAHIDFIETTTIADDPKGVDAIIVAGGDGTVIGCIATIIERDLPVGIVPLGTFNDLARTLGIPLDVKGAVEVIARRKERAIDVGYVNGKYFVNEASIGISSRISRLQTPELKQRFGLWAVFGTALQAFRYSQPIHAEVRYDHRIDRLKTIQLTVANSGHFGGLLEVPGHSIDDGWLDLYSVDIENFREAFAIAHALVRGKQQAVPGLRTIRAKFFEIRTRKPHRIAADAEPAGTTPATFEVRPKALRVFVAE